MPLLKSSTFGSCEAWRVGRGSLIAPNVATLLLESIEAQGAPAGKFKTDELIKAYGWHAVPGTVLFKEVPEVMALIKQNGIKTAIVTNAAQPMALRDIEMEEHQLLQYFPDYRLSAADAGVLKPHPGIFQMALISSGGPRGRSRLRRRQPDCRYCRSTVCWDASRLPHHITLATHAQWIDSARRGDQ